MELFLVAYLLTHRVCIYGITPGVRNFCIVYNVIDKMTYVEKRLFIARHGQTSTNTERRFSGFKNPPLTELGIEQANTLARELVNQEIDTIYTSDLKRAVQTSAIVSSLTGSRIIQLSDLRERRIGSWEGKTPEELALLYGSGWYKETPKDGESYRNYHNRITGAFIKIFEQADRNGEKNILMIGHGGPIVTFHKICGFSADSQEVGFGVPNATLEKYTFDGSEKKQLLYGGYQGVNRGNY